MFDTGQVPLWALNQNKEEKEVQNLCRTERLTQVH